MANVRDSDTSLWLHNKLGTSNDSWTGGSICSQLNAEVLRNIKDCFPDLQTQVKLKLLLSFFHIPRRNVEEWRLELEEILEVAQMDSEQWVSMLAEMMKTLPATGSLNLDIAEVDENKRIFSDLLNDLKKLVKKQTDMKMLPLECHYLNKSVLGTANQPNLTKHFTLKRKPKSAALRAELLQKSVDAASNIKKNATPLIPLRSRGMPRKMTDTTPLKGIPSRVPIRGGFSSPLQPAGGTPGALRTALPGTPGAMLGGVGRSLSGPRKDSGGIKLLDITEQPLGYAQAKKKKRMQAEAAAKEKANETPDYAAGLVPSSAPATPMPVPASPAPIAAPVIVVPPLKGEQNSLLLSNASLPKMVPANIDDSPEKLVQPPTVQPPAVQPAASAPKNPCPDLGNIVTIKLSEGQESVKQADDTLIPMMAETHFQMNYSTGEWKRIKKYRKLDDVPPPTTQIVVKTTATLPVPITPSQ
ncbi:hypothetical protein B566_EDAN002563 [Ephemera danica]|nr:hypothetical protein B566_EDAN002563 [Ephemera danica]